MNNHQGKNASYDLQELQFESTLGGEGVENDQLQIPIIDLTNFAARRAEITDQLWQAATEVGFFQLSHHGLDLALIEQIFKQAETFFALPKITKQQYPLKEGLNAGWEFMEQVRPSTGTADQKESYQVSLPHMDNLWPQELPEFQTTLLEFEARAWQLGMDILSCFADKLGFARDFFAEVHKRDSAHYQNTLRLLHYLPMAEYPRQKGIWRAGAHTDFDCLTMVFQKEGQGGLQVCGGKNATEQQTWSNVIPRTGIITCNIGDMLMRWSDDQLKSTLHRVRMPLPSEYQGPRYSLAYFCQANKDVVIQGPQKKYAPISAADFLRKRINANFSEAPAAK